MRTEINGLEEFVCLKWIPYLKTDEEKVQLATRVLCSSGMNYGEVKAYEGKLGCFNKNNRNYIGDGKNVRNYFLQKTDCLKECASLGVPEDTLKSCCRNCARSPYGNHVIDLVERKYTKLVLDGYGKGENLFNARVRFGYNKVFFFCGEDGIESVTVPNYYGKICNNLLSSVSGSRIDMNKVPKTISDCLIGSKDIAFSDGFSEDNLKKLKNRIEKDIHSIISEDMPEEPLCELESDLMIGRRKGFNSRGYKKAYDSGSRERKSLSLFEDIQVAEPENRGIKNAKSEMPENKEKEMDESRNVTESENSDEEEGMSIEDFVKQKKKDIKNKELLGTENQENRDKEKVFLKIKIPENGTYISSEDDSEAESEKSLDDEKNGIAYLDIAFKGTEGMEIGRMEDIPGVVVLTGKKVNTYLQLIENTLSLSVEKVMIENEKGLLAYTVKEGHVVFIPQKELTDEVLRCLFDPQSYSCLASCGLGIGLEIAKKEIRVPDKLISLSVMNDVAHLCYEPEFYPVKAYCEVLNTEPGNTAKWYIENIFKHYPEIYTHLYKVISDRSLTKTLKEENRYVNILATASLVNKYTEQKNTPIVFHNISELENRFPLEPEIKGGATVFRASYEINIPDEKRFRYKKIVLVKIFDRNPFNRKEVKYSVLGLSNQEIVFSVNVRSRNAINVIKDAIGLAFVDTNRIMKLNNGWLEIFTRQNEK